jgi:hypothetical protein
LKQRSLTLLDRPVVAEDRSTSLRVDRGAAEDGGAGVGEDQAIAEWVNQHHVQTAPGLLGDSWILLCDAWREFFGEQLLDVFFDLVGVKLDRCAWTGVAAVL